MIHILAIDPGKTGSATLFQVNFRGIALVGCLAFGLKENKANWEGRLRNLLWIWRPEIVVMERVHSMRGDGRRQAFTFGGYRKAAETVLKLDGYEWKLVEPQSWQRRVGCPRNRHLVGKKARRNQGRKDQKAIALRLFPLLSQTKGDVFASVLIGYAAALDYLQVPLGSLEPDT